MKILMSQRDPLHVFILDGARAELMRLVPRLTTKAARKVGSSWSVRLEED